MQYILQAIVHPRRESDPRAHPRKHPLGLAVRPEVAERIAELRVQQSEAADASPVGLLASLRRIIKAGESSENPTLVNAARLAVLDASRLQAELAEAQTAENVYIDNAYKSFQAELHNDERPEGKPDVPATPTTATPERPAGSPSAPLQRPSGSPGAPSGLPASAPKAPRKLPGLRASRGRR